MRLVYSVQKMRELTNDGKKMWKNKYNIDICNFSVKQMWQQSESTSLLGFIKTKKHEITGFKSGFCWFSASYDMWEKFIWE